MSSGSAGGDAKLFARVCGICCYIFLVALASIQRESRMISRPLHYQSPHDLPRYFLGLHTPSLL